MDLLASRYSFGELHEESVVLGRASVYFFRVAILDRFFPDQRLLSESWRVSNVICGWHTIGRTASHFPGTSILHFRFFEASAILKGDKILSAVQSPCTATQWLK
jgi:hypothetical protein